MKFHTDSNCQDDLQPALDQLQEYLSGHGLADDAAGRAEAIREMLEAAPKPGGAELPYFKYLKLLANDYDPAKSSEIDPWLEAIVAGRPVVAGMLFIASLQESFKLDGLVALLRAGVDLARPVPGVQVPLAKKGAPGRALVDASPIAAMMCFFDHEGWPVLEQKGLLPHYDQVPYAGRLQQADGTVAELTLLDYLLAMNPEPAEHLFVLDRLNLCSPDVKQALTDGAVTLLKQLYSIHQRDAYDTLEYLDGAHLVRAALLIGAGADLRRLASGLRDQKEYCLPHMLADVQKPEYRRYIVQALEAIADQGKRHGMAGNVPRIFDLGFRTETGVTPLHRAATYGYPEAVLSYIAAGADVNAVCKDLETPLHHAVRYLPAPTENIEILLNSGANVDARSHLGLTAEAMAKNNGQHIVAQMIAAHRARQAVDGVLSRAAALHTTSSKS